ncbi:MAG: cell division topological specificity factor MinE, partial [Defluviitaleaceae bacterium]|nr:cell division topological specificity factor MinE [Defluviitaleaceae bacterium]
MGISNLLASKPPQPRIVAKDRLKFALIYDRTGCSPQILENIKIDIIKVISNYLYVDEKMIDIQISQVDT